jgi:putative phage-type endonuclease
MVGQVTAPQRSPEWFAQRRGRVTGSLVGAILGLSPYMTREDALRSMVREYHGAISEFTGNVATEWGKANEATARSDYEMDAMKDVVEAGFVEFEDWLGASPDGYVDADGLLEIKCPYGIRNDPEPRFKRWREQPHYGAQVQIQLFVTGRKWCHVWQWTPFGQLLERVDAEADWLAENLPRLKQFHAEFISELDNPAHLEPRRAVLDTPAAHKMVAEWDQLTEAISLAEERRKEVLAEIVAAAGGKDSLVAGRKLTLTRRAGAVAYAKALKVAAPDFDVETFRSDAVEFWGLK